MPRHTVTLPDAARHAAHDFEGDPFVDFSSSNAHGPPSPLPPMGELPEKAMVPGAIPPESVLPMAATDHMSWTAMEQPPEGVPWWLDHVAQSTAQQMANDPGDQFDFSPSNAHGPPLEVLPVDLPDGAMVPENSPPNGMLPDGAAALVPGAIPPESVLPMAATDHMSWTAMEQPPEGGPWWLVDM